MGRTLSLVVLGLALPACSLPRRPERPTPPGRIRLGPERLSLRYEDPAAAVKQVLFERINLDRAQHGLHPLAYEPRAALAGDLFCRQAAAAGSFGHWDLAGRAPYLRWGLLRGVDYHEQNAASYDLALGPLDRPPLMLLLERHAEMMAETPPNDGHRRTILDPTLTHVGIGMAVHGSRFRMTEEFTRVAFDWLELPEGPLQAGGVALVAGKPRPGLEVGLLEVRFEPPPQPLLPFDPRRTARSYAYPPLLRALHPRAPPGFVYSHGRRGDFRTGRDGRVEVAVRLDAGAGSYVVVCHVRARGRTDEPLQAGTAVLLIARD